LQTGIIAAMLAPIGAHRRSGSGPGILPIAAGLDEGSRLGVAAMTARSDIMVRRMSFALDGDPSDWNGGDRFRSHLFNALSAMLPGGEKFFIDTARQLLPALGDPGLASDCRSFIAQEAAHSHQHRRYNDRLSQAGYAVGVLERTIAMQIQILTALLPLRWRAGFAAAFEHFTALIAEAALANRYWLEGARSEYGALWSWHSAEEIEHKSVAFDVFEAVGGGYRARVATMVLATLGLMVNMTGFMLYFLFRDLSVLRASVWVSGIRFLFWRSGLPGSMLWRYLAYYRPGFHPWDHENGHLLERWKLDSGR
jgi:hypothetical protein